VRLCVHMSLQIAAMGKCAGESNKENVDPHMGVTVNQPVAKFNEKSGRQPLREIRRPSLIEAIVSTNFVVHPNIMADNSVRNGKLVVQKAKSQSGSRWGEGVLTPPNQERKYEKSTPKIKKSSNILRLVR
jgi:hypothetical protein